MGLIDLTGKKFGRLFVVNRADSMNGHVRWLCKCDCGKECIVHGSSLKSGNTTSCGCYRIENAKKLYSGVRQNDKHLYAVWNGIKQRCRNTNNRSYYNYGGRGIKICDEWADNYEVFYNWAIRSGYKTGLEIDRIDYNGDYCESNCRFVQKEIQANNKRNVVLYTINGITKSLPQWCREYHRDYYTVRQRVYKLGWNIEDALVLPKNTKNKNKNNNRREGGNTDENLREHRQGSLHGNGKAGQEVRRGRGNVPDGS